MSISIISYNVNGIRAASRKGMFEWVSSINPDVICFQEIKALPEDIDKYTDVPKGYYQYWFSAQKKGYSGVGLLSKEEPIHVERGFGIDRYDREGRIIRADFPEYSVISIYLPSGSSGIERQDFKEELLNYFFNYIRELKKEIPRLVISGDYNICHKPIDIHNPETNKNSSGFLPQEREWMSELLDLGLVDSFRLVSKEPNNYTWWTYRSGARKKNKGWRIDYHLISDNLKNRCRDHIIHKHAEHSDHCPIELIIEI